MRLGWRQTDVAAKARVSATTVRRIERGELDSVPFRTVRAVLRPLEIDARLVARWRGGDLDRLMDEDHATLVGIVAQLLEGAGWTVQPEVSFAVYGERGSIDLLAWHPPSRTLLVVEIKTSLNSVEETLRVQDAKVRLAARVAKERFGWDAAEVAWMLALPDDTTSRRRVARHDAVLARTHPMRGRTARAWLAAPRRRTGLLLFLATDGRSPIPPRRRVRRRRAAPAPRPRATSPLA